MRGGVTRIGAWRNGCNRGRFVLVIQLFQIGAVLVTAPV